MTTSELYEQAQENYRISKQEVMVAVRNFIDTSEDFISAIKADKFQEIKNDQVMDEIQNQEQKYGEERKEVEDND